MPEVPYQEDLDPRVQQGIEQSAADVSQAVQELLTQYAAGSISRTAAEEQIAQIAGLVGTGLNQVDANKRSI